MGFLGDFIKWEVGREGGKYKKAIIAKGLWPLPFHIHLLSFEKGSSINWHVDEAGAGREQHQCNIFLRKAKEGGEFITKLPMAIDWSRFQVFRPDQNQHSVKKVKEGHTLVLSIRWEKDPSP